MRASILLLTAALLTAVSSLVISWLIKEISDLISGSCGFSFGTLLMIVVSVFVNKWIMIPFYMGAFHVNMDVAAERTAV